MRRRRPLVLFVGLGFYLVALGFLGGALAERIRFDRQRALVLDRLTATEQQLHTRLMSLERSTEHLAAARGR
jgi:hypothetical protein